MRGLPPLAEVAVRPRTEMVRLVPAAVGGRALCLRCGSRGGGDAAAASTGVGVARKGSLVGPAGRSGPWSRLSEEAPSIVPSSSFGRYRTCCPLARCGPEVLPFWNLAEIG